MTTNFESVQEIVLICTAQRLNIAQADNIHKYLYPLITRSHTKIIIDLRHVLFMDCNAVSCIISLNRIAQLHHSTIILCNLTEHVELLAGVLKLSRIINIERSIEQKKHVHFCTFSPNYNHNVKHIQFF